MAVASTLAQAVERAKALFFHGALDAAAEIFESVLAQHPEQPEALHFLGVIAYLDHRYDQAIRLMRKAQPRLSQDSELFSNLGLALQAAGQLPAAVTAFRRAVALAPGVAPHHAYLANALRDNGEIEAALSELERAVQLAPGYPLARYARGLCRLLQGDWRSPWADYEARIAADFARPYATAPWCADEVLPAPSSWSSPLQPADRLLVLPEQGLGDILFFLRHAPAVRSRCAGLDVCAPTPLHRLLVGAPGIDAVGDVPTARPVHTRVVLVGDLPLLCENSGLDHPPASLRLEPDDAARTAARDLLFGSGPGPLLGLTWRAGPQPARGEKPGRRKELPVGVLADAVRHWRGSVVSLQRNPRDGEVDTLAAQLGRPVLDLAAANEDLPLMLAVLDLLDEYVGVSNTNMYLRAGLGRTARVLVSCPPDWRWGEDLARSPWFPEFQLYRERRGFGWTDALARLTADLG